MISTSPADTPPGLAALRVEIGAVNDLLCAASVLTWDMRVTMPAASGASRGRQLATLADSARARLLSPATRRALDRADGEVATLAPDDPARREVEAAREAIAFHDRLPETLVGAKASLRAEAHAAWAAARAGNDFALFAPVLTRVVDLQRAYAQAIGFEAHPYDALVDLYEPGETVASLQSLFGRLRPALRALLDRAADGTPAPGFLDRAFPAEAQRRFGEAVAAAFGFDFRRGRLDFTLHPFEVSFTREDVRLTMRRAESFNPPAIFGAMHEAGHGLYEQSVDPAFTRTALATDLRQLYAVGGTSFGAHESQSRLWENHVGRSRTFWNAWFPRLRAAFAPALDDVHVEAFHAAVTRASPGLIRTDADELTYDAHIMLRVEIEADLIAGRLEVRDVPEAWNAAMGRDLGVSPTGDADGCLQDVHWSSGMFGSFCTYTIGNVVAAQLFEAASDEAAVREGVERAEYGPLRDWLSDRVCRHGRRFRRDELLERATGRALDVEPYLRHLTARYGR